MAMNIESIFVSITKEKFDISIEKVFFLPVRTIIKNKITMTKHWIERGLLIEGKAKHGVA